MKKLLFILALILFASCEKDREVECYKCLCETKILDLNAYYSHIIDTCLVDVEEFEKSGTWQTKEAKSRVMCWQQGEIVHNPGF